MNQPLPPPQAIPHQSWWRRRTLGQQSFLIGGAVVVGLVTFTVASSALEEDDTPTHTPVEAACRMMRAGDTPADAERAMRDLVDDATARSAVAAATANGC